MIKRLFWLMSIALGLGTTDVQAQTDVSGSVRGNWSQDGSPYRVIGAIRVDDGDVLTIEAGVEVRFVVNEPFNILGGLIAAGNENDSIIFSAQNRDGVWGGLRIVNPDSTVFLSYCILTDGSAQRGQGQIDSVGSGGNVFIAGGEVHIEHSRISYGRARSLGGGVAVWSGAPQFDDCLIVGNESDAFGGGIGLNGEGAAVFRNCSIIGGIASISGGGAYIAHSSTARFENCQFLSNISGRGEAATGGGVAVWNGASPRFDKCLFQGNISNAGGAAYLRGENTVPVFTWCDFVNNAVRDVDQVGGAVYIRGESSAEIRYCRFIGNDANWGGALYVKEPPRCSIHHNLFRQNGALRGGGAVATSTDLGEQPLILSNCTFFANRNTGLEPVAITGMARGASRLKFNSCIIWDNAPLFDGDTDVEVIYSIVNGGFEGENNTDENPKFFEGDSTWLVIRGDSPARDTGDPEIGDDQDGTRNDRGWLHFPVNALEGLPQREIEGESTTRRRATVQVSLVNTTDVPVYYRPMDQWIESAREIMFDVTSLTGDREINGAAWTADGIFIAGDDNGRAPRIYHLDENLNLRGQFRQPAVDGAPGFQDLATDGGSVLFGANESQVIEFTTDGEFGDGYDLPPDFGPVQALTADFHAAVEPTFFFNNAQSELVIANGDVIEEARIALSDPPLALAAKWNSRALYLATETESGGCVLSLLDIETENIHPLYELTAPEGSRIGGLEITQDFSGERGMLFGIWRGDGDTNDHLFAESLYISWLVIIPEVKLAMPGDTIIWDVTFAGDQVPEGRYEDRFYITVNGWGEDNFLTARLLNRLDKVADEGGVPAGYTFMNVYPNPFNVSAQVRFQIPRSGRGVLTVRNIGGQVVGKLYDGYLPSGPVEIGFNAHQLPSGLYYFTLSAGEWHQTQRAVLVK